MTLAPPVVVGETPSEAVSVEVVEGEVGRTLTLTTTVRRPDAPVATNELSGVVTRVAASGEFTAGDVVYVVGDVPVAVAAGTVPMWRDLGEGAKGEDVAQVQAMLAARGAVVKADGSWGAATTRAVKAWQKQIGAPQTGVVPLGGLIVVDAVPVALRVETKVLWPGAVLSGGEEVVFAAAGAPTFAMEVTSGQEALVPLGSSVVVKGPEVAWVGVVASAKPTDMGSELEVTAPDGGVLCGVECATLPPAEATYLLTDVQVVPPRTGPVVPVAAITTQPDGATTVAVVTAGSQTQTRPVQVLTVADGLAVVEGVSPGERVRVLGKATTTGTPATTPGEDTGETIPGQDAADPGEDAS